MKKTLLLALVLSVNLSFSQTRDDIFKTSKIYFYGYDFTHFQFFEPKREGENEKIKGMLFELTALLNDLKPEKKYENLLDKDTVIFDQQTVMNLNKNIESKKIMGYYYMKNLIPKDSLQNIVNQYNTNGKSGIGFVQIIECFYKPKKETSLWFVFFDISTKKILDSYEISNNDADSYHGLAAYWGVGITSAMGKYKSAYYSKELKKFKKGKS